MGGKNHQPCSGYLKNSTKLSRELSRAVAHLELANVALEDALLAELDGDRAAVGGILAELDHSGESLGSAYDALRALRQQMVSEGYQDLPPYRSMSLPGVGRALSQAGMVHDDAWARVAQLVKEGSFFAVIDNFHFRLEHLRVLHGGLREGVAALAHAASVGELRSVLEENQPGNIKVAFARVYTAWNNLNAEFLASSMLSTEVWYAFNGFPSLVDVSARRIAG